MLSHLLSISVIACAIVKANFILESKLSMKHYVYGGAFNPPTIAHQQIIQELVNYARQQEHGAGLIVLPSGNRADKTIATPLKTRLDYLRALINDVDTTGVPVLVEDMELHREHQVQTYDTAQELAEKYPHEELVWVFGADSFNTMPEWKNGLWLIENLSILVIERQGYAVNLELLSNQEKIRISSISDTSSTELRERILSDSNYRDIVGNNVFKVLQEAQSS